MNLLQLVKELTDMAVDDPRFGKLQVQLVVDGKAVALDCVVITNALPIPCKHCGQEYGGSDYASDHVVELRGSK